MKNNIESQEYQVSKSFDKAADKKKNAVFQLSQVLQAQGAADEAANRRGSSRVLGMNMEELLSKPSSQLKQPKEKISSDLTMIQKTTILKVVSIMQNKTEERAETSDGRSPSEPIGQPSAKQSKLKNIIKKQLLPASTGREEKKKKAVTDEMKRMLQIEHAQNQKHHKQLSIVITTLEKPNSQRTEAEIEQVVNFLKTIQFFKDRKIKHKDMMELVSAFRLESQPEGHNTINYGEAGHSFFIILQGIVSVQVPNPKIKNWRIRRIQHNLDMEWLQQMEEKYYEKKREMSLRDGEASNSMRHNLVNEISKLEKSLDFKSAIPTSEVYLTTHAANQMLSSREQSSSNGSLNIPTRQAQNMLLDESPSKSQTVDLLDKMIKVLNLSKQDIEEYQQKAHDRKHPPDWFVEVAKLTAGQSFGELALLNDAKRAATVTCVKPSFFAVIERAEYEKVLKRIELRGIQRRIEFFQNLPYLMRWTKTQIQKIIYSFSEKVYTRNQIIYQQNEQANMVYIIKEGEVEVLRTIRKLAQKSKVNEAENKTYLGHSLLNTKRGKQTEVKATKHKDQLQKPALVRLCQMCSGQMFGEEDVVNCRKYTTTVRCISTQAVIYCIKAEEFLMKLSKEDYTWKMILGRVKQKDAETILKIKQNMVVQMPNFLDKLRAKQTVAPVTKTLTNSVDFGSRNMPLAQEKNTRLFASRSSGGGAEPSVRDSIEAAEFGESVMNQSSIIPPKTRNGSQNSQGSFYGSMPKSKMKYRDILEKHNLKLTQDRIEDFRETMKEIIDIKNGRKKPDISPKQYQNQQVDDDRASSRNMTFAQLINENSAQSFHKTQKFPADFKNRGDDRSGVSTRGSQYQPSNFPNIRAALQMPGSRGNFQTQTNSPKLTERNRPSKSSGGTGMGSQGMIGTKGYASMNQGSMIGLTGKTFHAPSQRRHSNAKLVSQLYQKNPTATNFKLQNMENAVIQHSLADYNSNLVSQQNFYSILQQSNSSKFNESMKSPEDPSRFKFQAKQPATGVPGSRTVSGLDQEPTKGTLQNQIMAKNRLTMQNLNGPRNHARNSGTNYKHHIEAYMGGGQKGGPKLTSQSNQFSVVQTSQESIIGGKELESETAKKLDNSDINDSIGLGASIGPEFKNSAFHGQSKQEVSEPMFGRNPGTQVTQASQKGKRKPLVGSIGLNQKLGSNGEWLATQEDQPKAILDSRQVQRVNKYNSFVNQVGHPQQQMMGHHYFNSIILPSNLNQSLSLESSDFNQLSSIRKGSQQRIQSRQKDPKTWVLPRFKNRMETAGEPVRKHRLNVASTFHGPRRRRNIKQYL